MTTHFNIGELASAAGTKSETIRYYEKIGLLNAPLRSGTGRYRSYSLADLSRLSFVRRSRELGFTIDQVRTLLSLADQREQDCCRVDALTEQHLASIEQKLSDLSALQRELTALRTSCRGGVIADCRILDALGPRRSS